MMCLRNESLLAQHCTAVLSDHILLAVMADMLLLADIIKRFKDS